MTDEAKKKLLQNISLLIFVISIIAMFVVGVNLFLFLVAACAFVCIMDCNDTPHDWDSTFGLKWNG